MMRLAVFFFLAGSCALLVAGCEGDSNPLVPYEGERPLLLQQVTQSFTPDVQWVGGRVAAVGVNRGERAALDSSLVWLMTADGDDISSHVTVGSPMDASAVQKYGGTPSDSLADGGVYTVWLATKAALDAGLASSALDAHAFVDTTVTMSLVLRGTTRGGVDVDMTVTKDERLLGTTYRIDWTPAVPFRQVAVRKGSGSAGFRDLVWHVVQPEDTRDAIVPPVVIGEPPPGTEQAVAWPEGGFEHDTYVVWMTNSTWKGDFGLRPGGMAYRILFNSNFE